MTRIEASGGRQSENLLANSPQHVGVVQAAAPHRPGKQGISGEGGISNYVGDAPRRVAGRWHYPHGKTFKLQSLAALQRLQTSTVRSLGESFVGRVHVGGCTGLLVHRSCRFRVVAMSVSEENGKQANAGLANVLRNLLAQATGIYQQGSLRCPVDQQVDVCVVLLNEKVFYRNLITG